MARVAKRNFFTWYVYYLLLALIVSINIRTEHANVFGLKIFIPYEKKGNAIFFIIYFT